MLEKLLRVRRMTAEVSDNLLLEILGWYVDESDEYDGMAYSCARLSKLKKHDFFIPTPT
jgi:hypothetical protein